MFIYTLAFTIKMPSFLFKNNSNAIKFIYGAVSHNSSGICVYRSAKSGLFKTINKKKTYIFGPHCDCLACNGTGCGHCK